ncbi:MAG: PD-(D/E)XK nuclease family protein [Bacteroidetes bacterium]|nr:PD-(D/E)XK nuclease family protein [Bacteroidota bacterium]MBS1539182.1 PD-(D/E)XK nuclease family protein [Bacteroidota bacterium]
MKTFLQELAEEIYRDEPDLSRVTVIFPNRRAVLYFKESLADIIKKPVFSPQLITLEDFIAGFSSLKIPDKLELVHRLHRCYQELIKTEAETFDQFFMWGEMLLRDFDEADRYLIDARLLFADLRHLKELDTGLDYLSEEQKEFLKKFWQGFEERQSHNKNKFINVWTKLYPLYQLFNERLEAEGLAYEGKVHRLVADTLERDKTKLDTGRKLWFAGFNALTKAEEKIIAACLEETNTVVRWDDDQYYVNDERQEAGKFLNAYRQHPILGKTFSSNVPDHLRASKKIELLGAAQPIGQVKLLANELAKHLKNGMSPEDTVVILPDEKMLLPVMHSLSPIVDKLNISIGFPWGSSPVYNLIEVLVELQIHAGEHHFNFRAVQNVLLHPYLMTVDTALAQKKLNVIRQNNWVSVPIYFLTTEGVLHPIIFRTEQKITTYLLEVFYKLKEQSSLDELDKEFLLKGERLLNRLDAVWTEVQPQDSSPANRLKSFLRLFRHYARTEKIPFAGEPLKGLPIMGTLESRNLDFKNVFILSLNEGVFPSLSRNASYVPYNIRKAYGLPTDEHTGAIYAYLFYRMLQRAHHIFLFYNTEPNVLGQGELSRYVQQMMYEGRWTIEQQVLHNPVQSQENEPIVIEKNESVIQALEKINTGSQRSKGFSPSALNTYLECSLKFYFQYVAHIREMGAVQEEIDPRLLGHLLHRVLEQFYRQRMDGQTSKIIEATDFEKLNERISRLIDEAFREEYHLSAAEEVIYEGQRVVVHEVVHRLALQILTWDKKQAPFTIVGLEQNKWTCRVAIDHRPGEAVLGGTIDRIDRKDDVVRIIDYKTGKDKLSFKDIASLFSSESKDRNKAAFQILLYALLYRENHPNTHQKIMPGLLNRNNLFDEDFQFGLVASGQALTDVTPLLAEITENLKNLLNEIFDPTKKFTQTTNTKTCEYCLYREICYR